MRRLNALLVLGLAASAATAQDADAVAKQLANPIASLTSVPFQFNYEENLGAAGDGERLRVNVQPVIPFSIGEDWNLISRTIVPLVSQDDVFAPGTSDEGFGDTLQSLFFSPKAVTKNGWVWGVGPAFLLPTASEETLGGERWAAGPTAVALRQTEDGWTYGLLANHLVSFAGDEDRRDVNATFAQPFLSKRIGRGRNLSTSMEATYDWESATWNAPLNVGITQVLPVGKQLISLQAGGAVYLDKPPGGPDWSLRFTFTLLYAKR